MSRTTSEPPRAPAAALDRWRSVEWTGLGETELSPADHLAIDDVLTEAVRHGRRGPALRFWAWAAPAVVLGRFQSFRNEVDPDSAAELGVTVVRRASGGGAMFVQPGGTITYSLYLPERLLEGVSIRDSYELCDRWAVETLNELGVKCHYAPLNDIAADDGKIAGAAQARRPGVVLHHTTIAYRLDNAEMARVLRIGRPKLSAQGTPSAAKWVSPLTRHTDLSRGEIVTRLTAGFRARFGLLDGMISTEEWQAAARLAGEKYATIAWAHDLP